MNFWSPKTCFSPRALALGSLASSSPRKDPQKLLLLGYSLGWFFFTNTTFPNRWLRRGKVEKKSTFPWHPGFFCFFHIRHQECHSSPSWDVDAGVGCWDAGAGFFCPNLVKLSKNWSWPKKRPMRNTEKLSIVSFKGYFWVSPNKFWDWQYFVGPF